MKKKFYLIDGDNRKLNVLLVLIYEISLLKKKRNLPTIQLIIISRCLGISSEN